MISTVYDGKHLSIKERRIIEDSLNEGCSLIDISRLISKDERTISKEIKRNRTFVDMSRKRKAWKKDIEEYNTCKVLNRYPFVCNSCNKKSSCFVDHFYYICEKAQAVYENRLKEARCGIDLTKSELNSLDKLVKEGSSLGQSIYAICENNKERINKTPATIYSYVKNGVLSTRPIDLRRAVKMKPRLKTSKYVKSNTEREAYIGRKMEDYYTYLISHPNCFPVQMDTVEGSRNSKKYLFTIHFVVSHFMLIYLINSQMPNEIKRVLDMIEEKLGYMLFKKAFPILIGDRGKEFLNPTLFENGINNKQRTKVFYCDALCSNQKPQIEKNHTLVRYIIPKGSFMDVYTNKDIAILTNNINSYPRKELDGNTPYDITERLYGKEFLDKLNIEKVDLNKVNLTPSLLVHHK